MHGQQNVKEKNITLFTTIFHWSLYQGNLIQFRAAHSIFQKPFKYYTNIRPSPSASLFLSSLWTKLLYKFVISLLHPACFNKLVGMFNLLNIAVKEEHTGMYYFFSVF